MPRRHFQCAAVLRQMDKDRCWTRQLDGVCSLSQRHYLASEIQIPGRPDAGMGRLGVDRLPANAAASLSDALFSCAKASLKFLRHDTEKLLRLFGSHRPVVVTKQVEPNFSRE